MKKITVLSFLVFLIFSSLTFAMDADIIVTPDEVAPCPDWGLHRMYASDPIVIVRNAATDEQILSWLGEYECSCGEIFVCSGTPQLSNPIFYYFYDTDLFGKTSGLGVTTYYTNRTTARYTSNITLPGYRFYQYY
jgi:hypothetical protein